MLNRRHLRIKVLQALYAYYQSDEQSFRKVETELFNAIDRIYDLYLYLLLTMPELRDIAEHRIEENKKKIRPTEQDLNPNRKFVDNSLIERLANDPKLIRVSEQSKVNWLGDEKHELLRKMFINMRESETYFEHMNNGATGFDAEKQMLLDLFKNDIANFPLLYSYFEEESIHWIDDIDFACSMVVKTLKSMEEGGEKVGVLDLYKDEEDEQEFVRVLLRKTISMDSENEQVIDHLTTNWELDRIAKMDTILMKMAITEFQMFNTIPTKVTLNEYIEISKFYSTPKSNGFINGILDKAIDHLTKENKIVKVGRGLMD